MRIFISLLIFLIVSCNAQEDKKMKFTNKLANESSPYLLQHANNPVNWYPWGNEALQKAKEENKLIIISIGYAACHWCHVMEHESFEDTSVAQVMNDFYVSIKVDREERPDIDQIYMDAAYLITGRGGWPLNIIALPNGKPVYAGTYFRKEDWLKILTYFKDLYQDEPEKFNEQADKLTDALNSIKIPDVSVDDSIFSINEIKKAFEGITNLIDFVNGGTRGAPKFPMPDIYEFLLQYYFHTKDNNALEAVKITLDKIANGGIYDHIGGGFARYSTDDIWKVPHFEKMLYDNAQLVSLYSNAYKVTGNKHYKNVVYETLDYIKREMTDESGGFYSSLDADSEGEEGKFYVWKRKEVIDLLGSNAELFCEYYNISETGNWEGKNIPFITIDKSQLLKKHNLKEVEFDKIIFESKKVLFEERSKRIRPGLDDKILTSWNALMIAGYTDAYNTFGEEEYLVAAISNGEFFLNNMMDKDGKLDRNYKNGKSTINAFLDDYAYTIEAFIYLYESTFDEKWIYSAKKLADYAIEHFADKKSGMFFFTSDIDDPLITRRIDFSDNVTPSSNSSMVAGLQKLSKYFYSNGYEEITATLIKIMKEPSLKNPAFNSYWLTSAIRQAYPFYEIGIVGNESIVKRKEIAKEYLPNISLFGTNEKATLEILNDRFVEGKTLIYVCENRVCQLPVEQVSEALSQASN
ncbi:MAG: thioredoxin domain-containing protein [Ignavibacteria bacterium]|nr:thioredoxin domain-containing protein [Ignavibacteria bacterium]MBT8382260.1 thioredoxin domain-containing protein [Ignavibacteria bacterium]MBT8390933.1 thioredoxin domain-containing protein [Ignavibacteria bacterium]NNJ51558.1 thioredoxin domain-containing protein [Ignavibacteriaceae bacterium]NNL19949.1 thioredoxin domain-containing protein [Ignavibacteriaceae bacterium]